MRKNDLLDKEGPFDERIRSLLDSLTSLDEQHLTSAVREKVDYAQGVYAEFREGKLSAQKAREMLEELIAHPEMQDLPHLDGGKLLN